MPEYKKEWMQKANIDYFSPFVSLWLGFNSWFRSHYCEIEPKNDRNFINTLKTDTSARNKILKNFKSLMSEDKIKENIRFKSDLESLIYSLNRVDLRNPDQSKYKQVIKFETALIDYARKDDNSAYINLLKEKGDRNKIQLDEKYVLDDLNILCAGLIEILYQIRCLLIHGNLEPEEENHEVIKYCYFILYALMDES